MDRFGSMVRPGLYLVLLGALGNGAGAQEVLEQWGLSVVYASSSPSSDAGSFAHVAGPPDSGCESTTGLTFVEQSWRPGERDGGEERIEVMFAQPVRAFAVRPNETSGGLVN